MNQFAPARFEGEGIEAYRLRRASGNRGIKLYLRQGKMKHVSVAFYRVALEGEDAELDKAIADGRVLVVGEFRSPGGKVTARVARDAKGVTYRKPKDTDSRKIEGVL